MHGEYVDGHAAGDRERFALCKQDLGRALGKPMVTPWEDLIAEVRTLRKLLAEQQRAFIEGMRVVEAERAELLATLANERGEGEPPVEGWTWDGSAWLLGDLDEDGEQFVVLRDATGPGWEAQLHEAEDDTCDVVGEKPTARELMRFISEANAAASEGGS